jgi:galactose-1-phosphate uridylyltransferase
VTAPLIEPLIRLPDGTIKQVSPLTGTQVWSVPGRGFRPLGEPLEQVHPLVPAEHDRHCAFCLGRKLETTPEIARVVRERGQWRTLHVDHAEDLDATVPKFRLIPNLFEILSYDYWRLTHGFRPTLESDTRRTAYLSTPAGREHVRSIVRTRLRAEGAAGARLATRSYEQDLAEAIGFFASNHQVIVARRHFVDGATDDSQLAGSGTLPHEEHHEYTRLAIRTARDLYRDNPHARYVSIFQNWLRPAGASFDHLHKQLVAIDELGAQMQWETDRLRREPNLYEQWGVGYAAEQGLVVACTRSAVAFAGVGHRYPSIEIHSLVGHKPMWELSDDEVRDFSDVLHACHAATGVHVPSNEEWHHRPPSVDLAMPLRVVLKWRVSTLAGFEGGTKIYVNTIDPWTVRNRVVERLRGLIDAKLVSPRVTLP